MTCGSFVGQCLEGDTRCPDQFQCPVCCNPFAGIYGFSEVDTEKRFPGCFLGILNPTGGSRAEEIADGHWCGFGCAGSPDDMAACSDGLLNLMADSVDGTRFLRPREGLDPPTLDAHGMLHDLISNTYWPVPRETIWERGSCWFNDGRECFAEDGCACWARGEFFTPKGSGRCSGVLAGEPLPFILPDPMMRTGWGWPPRDRIGTNAIGGRDFYCRRFADARFGDVIQTGTTTVSAPALGAQPGLNEPMLGPITASYLECSSNFMAWCSAFISKPTVLGDSGQFEEACGTAEWFERGPGSNVPDHDLYYLDGIRGSVIRRRFDELIVSRGPDPPRIADCEDASPLQRETISLKNRIIDYVLTNTIGGVNFDRLDHLQVTAADNSGLGKYRRRWSGFGIEIPGVFGQCRLQESGCSVTCRLQITSVAAHAIIVLQALRPDSQESLDRMVEPLVTFMLVVGVEVRAELSEACGIRSWTGETVPLSLRGLEVEPPIDRIQFVGPDGQPVQIPKTVEWRGFLGGHSRPDSESARTDVSFQEDFSICESVADVIQDVEVPGWPMRADSSPDEPRGTYAGSVRVGFRP